ncbi:hypothetical protein JCM6882_002742 [Rhodosporidiobolus microsporus]
MTFTYLITGASRGLGLAYVSALLAARPDAMVVATARNPDTAEQLKKVAEENEGRVFLLKLDVADAESCKAAAEELEKSGFLGDSGLDALINNAGIPGSAHSSSPSETTPTDLLETFSTNVFGVVNVTQAFLPLLRKGQGKQLFTISSSCGSIEWFGKNALYPAYSISKTAVNMYMRKVAVELEPEGFTVITVCPGYVKTDFNSGGGVLSLSESVEPTLANIFLKVSPKDNGRFIQYDGETVPW